MTRFNTTKYALFFLLLGVMALVADTVPPPVGV